MVFHHLEARGDSVRGQARLLQRSTAVNTFFDSRGRAAKRALRAGCLAVVGLAGAMPSAVHAEPVLPPGAVEARQPGYRLAVSGGISAGTAGWGTELSGTGELSARVMVLPWLAAGLSYLSFNAPNNEGYNAFQIQALELHVGWRPVVGRWIDPFLRVGALGVVGSNGGYMNSQTTSRWGVESTAGVDFVWLPIAVGAHAQYGFTNQAWALVGLHLEVRI
jgi:hypothetical protein